MENRAFLPVKSDVIFRLFYADERNQEFLVSLLKSMLRLPEDDYNEIEIADPHLLREFDDDKLAVIDVKLHTKSKKVIHIEIQLLSEMLDNNCYPNNFIIQADFAKSVIAAA